MATFPLFEHAFSYVQTSPATGKSSRLGKVFPANVYDEISFRQMLNLERRRSERSNKPSVFMLLNCRGMSAAGSNSFLKEVTSALSAAARETDILGWHDSRLVLGAIFTEIGCAENCGLVIEKVRKILRQVLTADQLEAVRCDFQVLPEMVQSAGIPEFRRSSRAVQQHAHRETAWVPALFPPGKHEAAVASQGK
jgi:hypothetical protein